MPFCVPGVSFKVSQPEGGWPVATNISSNSELLEFWSILSSLSFMSLQPKCNCYGRHFNHRLYITYTLQAPKKEEAECHGRQIALQRNAENRAVVTTLTSKRHLTSLYGEKPWCLIFSFSSYSFLDCDMKEMKKSQTQISPAKPVSVYTDNHLSLHWRSLLQPLICRNGVRH